ncbi:MAG: hypothetical protein M0P16_03830 [Syntrophales bacterium]|jgi:hypothetical protein|nr:hypothetical protein [Syntrophales bacterium]MCK9391569.1 hypothetical protein [Syntrophales bacterium]
MDTLTVIKQLKHIDQCDATQKPDNFIHSFLFGNACITQDDQGVRSRLKMTHSTEGWIGIPHGGIGMGILMELALHMRSAGLHSVNQYPFNVEYRLGGASLRIGDVVEAAVIRNEDGLSGRILQEGEDNPYLLANIHYGKEGPHNKAQFQASLPVRYEDIENRLLPLPYYRNCFVCGVEREEPGLRRRFYFVDGEGAEKIVVSIAGFDEDDMQSFNRFQRDGIFHSLPILALIDETLGLAAFMVSASGGVTVRIDYTFYRDIQVGERLLFFGRGGKLRGKTPSRMMCWASGGAAAIQDDGMLEPVVSASGQWLGVPALTRQMREALIPEELNRRAFDLAGS